jgi:hypothetical protein
MKLINRKTRKALNKSIRKAVKKGGPAAMAALASGIASSLATLAQTEAPGKRGKSNLATMAERVSDSLTDGDRKKSRIRNAEKKRHSETGELTRSH